MSKDNNFDNLFENPQEIVDNSEGIVDINIDGINDDANVDANDIVSKLLSNQFDEDFLKQNPSIKKKIELEKEGLRILIKNKNSNEQIHDILMGAIGRNPDNASLYGSLSKLESTLLSIQKQIDEKITTIMDLFKNVQLELNLQENLETNQDDLNENLNMTRGSKEYINAIRANYEASKREKFDVEEFS